MKPGIYFIPNGTPGFDPKAPTLAAIKKRGVRMPVTCFEMLPEVQELAAERARVVEGLFLTRPRNNKGAGIEAFRKPKSGGSENEH